MKYIWLCICDAFIIGLVQDSRDNYFPVSAFLIAYNDSIAPLCVSHLHRAWDADCASAFMQKMLTSNVCID